MLARCLAFCLVHFARTTTLARVERAIFREVQRRAEYADQNHPSPEQWVQRVREARREHRVWKAFGEILRGG